jgi:hypothetical protein
VRSVHTLMAETKSVRDAGADRDFMHPAVALRSSRARWQFSRKVSAGICTGVPSGGVLS